jgi:hypothetical protein
MDPSSVSPHPTSDITMPRESSPAPRRRATDFPAEFRRRDKEIDELRSWVCALDHQVVGLIDDVLELQGGGPSGSRNPVTFRIVLLEILRSIALIQEAAGWWEADAGADVRRRLTALASRIDRDIDRL